MHSEHVKIVNREKSTSNRHRGEPVTNRRKARCSSALNSDRISKSQRMARDSDVKPCSTRQASASICMSHFSSRSPLNNASSYWNTINATYEYSSVHHRVHRGI